MALGKRPPRPKKKDGADVPTQLEIDNFRARMEYSEAVDMYFLNHVMKRGDQPTTEYELSRGAAWIEGFYHWQDAELDIAERLWLKKLTPTTKLRIRSLK